MNSENIIDRVMTILDETISECYESRDRYPNNTKFIDLQIDILEELKEKYKYEFDLMSKQ